MDGKKIALWVSICFSGLATIIYIFSGLFYFFKFPMTGEEQVFWDAVSYFIFAGYFGYTWYWHHKILDEGYDR